MKRNDVVHHNAGARYRRFTRMTNEDEVKHCCVAMGALCEFSKRSEGQVPQNSYPIDQSQTGAGAYGLVLASRKGSRSVTSQEGVQNQTLFRYSPDSFDLPPV